ncbi:TolC family protein [Pelomonas sp. KK5]|uniref:TolC family protein n=1 Tax=Pelomonas sp. KK5 TaxID=1855730 RepID=UPI0026F42E67|nr:TolC family protein [Pelomonas sp. KK5]
MHRLRAAIGFALPLLLSSPLAQAADAPAFGVLLQQSLARAPILLEQQANVEAARLDAAQSRHWLNPRLDAQAEDLGAPGSGGQSPRQSTYSISQPLELGGKRASRIAVSDRESDVAEARRREAQIAWAARLAVAYGTVEAAQARRRVAGDELARASDDLRAARAQVEAGKEAAVRVAQAEAGAAAARGAERAAAADLTQALEELSALVGAQERFTGISASLFGTAPVRGMAADESPALRVAQSERDASEARLQVEERRWIPDLSVTAGVRRYAWTSQSGYVVGLSASIPLFDRNRDAVAAARQRVQAADARVLAARLEASAARRSAQAQLEAAEGQLEAAIEGERACAEGYRLGRIGYDAGRTSLVELLFARRAWSEAQRSTIDARLARVRSLAALAQVEGRLAFGETQ